MTDDNAVSVQSLSKEFYVDKVKRGLWGTVKGLVVRDRKVVTAVDNISFSIKRGEFVGYVGENGAGKSTTIKILTGILAPTSGKCTVIGRVPYEDRYHNAFNIGVVFGQRSQLWWDIPLRESFSILKKIYRVNDESYEKRIQELMDSMALLELLDTPVRKLSLGQRMRCELAASLVHNPQLLFLDEPTIGLDVLAKEKIRDFLRFLNKTYGTTIILTTHDMSDIEKLCNRLIVIDKGSIIYDGSKEGLKKDFVHDKLIEVEFADEFRAEAISPELVLVKETGKKKCFVFKKNQMNFPDVIEKLVKEHSITDLSVRDPSLEAIVKAIYEEGSSYIPGSTGKL